MPESSRSPDEGGARTHRQILEELSAAAATAATSTAHGLGGKLSGWANLTGVGFAFVFCSILLYNQIRMSNLQYEQNLKAIEREVQNYHQRQVEHSDYQRMIDRNHDETQKAREEIKDTHKSVIELLVRVEKVTERNLAHRDEAMAKIISDLGKDQQKTRDELREEARKVAERLESGHKEIHSHLKALTDGLRKMDGLLSPKQKGEKMAPAED